MRIRLARATDLAEIAMCEELAFAMSTRRGNTRDISQIETLAAEINEGLIHVVVASSRILGYISYSAILDHLYVDSLAVLPRHHRKGVGRHLLAHAEKTALREGLGSVRLFTDGRIGGNVLFYRSLGYHETDRCLENDFCRVFYRKDIARRTADL